jgi:alkanesulfonate monooxygenase SsuD/methylene tetrahydromethanopterin reductase-like flavin-dependent oxidoreductase (luciferase family)
MEMAYSLASEELHQTDMVHAARRAEELGFQSVSFGEEVLPKV